jgi:hypothetical protein
MLHMSDRRNLIVLAYIAVGLVGAVGVLCAPLLAMGWRPPYAIPNAARIVVESLAALPAMGWAVFFATRAYLAWDEFQREKEKSAWYWGSSIGLAASAPVLFFIGAGGLHWLDPAIPSGIHLMRAFMIGYFLAVAPMGCGYLVARIWPRRTFAR